MSRPSRDVLASCDPPPPPPTIALGYTGSSLVIPLVSSRHMRLMVRISLQPLPLASRAVLQTFVSVSLFPSTICPRSFSSSMTLRSFLSTPQSVLAGHWCKDVLSTVGSAVQEPRRLIVGPICPFLPSTSFSFSPACKLLVGPWLSDRGLNRWTAWLGRFLFLLVHRSCCTYHANPLMSRPWTRGLVVLIINASRRRTLPTSLVTRTFSSLDYLNSPYSPPRIHPHSVVTLLLRQMGITCDLAYSGRWILRLRHHFV